jgi:hypothetical protein
MHRAGDGSFIAALAYAQGWPITVLTIAESGAIIRDQAYGIGYENRPIKVIPAGDGGCFLSVSGIDSRVIKILPSGEIGWQKAYGSENSLDEITLLGKASTGGCVLAGWTNSWGGLQNALWVMTTVADGSIGPNCYFIKDDTNWPVEESSILTEVTAAVTDTAAAGQDVDVLVQSLYPDLTAWGPTALPTLGKPYCTLNMRVKYGLGTTTPPEGDHFYATGARVQINATPAEDYVFQDWSGNIYHTTSSLTILMDGDKDIAASFGHIGPDPIEEYLSKKFGCFVATAAYGDPSHPDVEALRRFRDRYLMKSRAGRTFVELYYRYSPPLARFVAKYPVLRAMSRALLYPAVLLCRMLNDFEPQSAPKK